MKIQGHSIWAWVRILIGFGLYALALGILWVSWVVITPNRKEDTFRDFLNYMI